MSQLTPEIKARVEEKLRQCCEIASRQTGRKFSLPHIKFAVRGTVAGRAHCDSYTVNFNATLLAENVDKFIARTVPHEMAHLIDFELNRGNFIGGFGRKRSIHGPSWKRIMMMLGADPSRCHTYDTSNSRVKKGGRSTRYMWQCKGCGKTFRMGPQRHRKQMASGGSMYRLHGCGSHGGSRYLGIEGITQPKPEPMPKAADAPKTKPVQPPTPPKASKYDKCRSIYFSWRASADRKRMIGLFVAEAGCTPAGAATYYAKLKKEFG